MTALWKPIAVIADPELARRCWAAIGEIEQGLLAAAGNGDLHDLYSLSGGSAGVAVFLAYLDAARHGSGDASGDASEVALDALGRSIDGLGEAVMPPAFYGGFTGIGWAVEHLTRRFFEADEDLCSAIDDGLRQLLSLPDQRLQFELIAGLAGYGVYLVERLPNPEAAALLGRIVDLLEEGAEETEDGLTWHTPPEWLPPQQRETMPGGCYNLGVAHGVPGVLGFLAAARREGFADPRLPRLADGLVRWMLGRRLGREESVFPAVWIPEQPADPTRTAWCYGDPGIAAVLLSAARSFSRADWEAEALDLARRSARRSESEAGTMDAGLCHGTAGLAHLFNRLYQATGDPELREAALAWLRRTLDLRRPGEGLAGFLTYMPVDGEPRWTAESGFLVGAAGVGLALLAAVSDVEPGWDRVLLAAVPPGD